MLTSVMESVHDARNAYAGRMPSYPHELLLLLFRNRFSSAADLLRKLDVQLPDYDEICTESADLSDLRPAEYRADLVLFLQSGSRKVLGVIVEVQLARDDDKSYVWPAYIANLRARHRCPVCLLVITIKDAVARWAAQPIELGPGTHCTPWVVGPANTPAITTVKDANENVELAVLSAIEYGQHADIQLAARIASVAILASAGIDPERSGLYHDLILISLANNDPEALKATMNSLKYEYRSEILRSYVAQGREEGRAEGLLEGRAAGRAEGNAEGKAAGKAEGRIEIILKMLALRFGLPPADIETRVRSARAEQLDAVIERMLTAQTLEEALGPVAQLQTPDVTSVGQ